MKKYKYISIALMSMLMLAMTSCKEELLEAPVDPEGCYGVYFPDQPMPGEQEPGDATDWTFTVRRSNVNGTIGVPVEVIDTNGVYKIDDIVFRDGEKETTFNVSYSEVAIGNSYPCNIRIADPKYYSNYSDNLIELAFTVSVVQWDVIKTLKDEYCDYRDGLLSFLFEKEPKINTMCKIYQRHDRPNYFRIENLYNPEFISKIMGDNEDYSKVSYKQSFIIDATDTAKVWIPSQNVGIKWPPYGEFFILSNVEQNNDIIAKTPLGEAQGIYGTYSPATGIISFPNDALLVGFGTNVMGFIGNNYTRFVLPGFSVFDYEVSVTTKMSKDGKVPVSIKMSKDVDHVKYAIFKGKLNDFEAETEAALLGTPESGAESFKTINKNSDFDIELSETGEYTIVCGAYDKEDKYQAYGKSNIQFLKPGDDSKKVIIDTDFFKSEKYATEKWSTKNSLVIYLSGKDLVDLKIGVFRTASVKKDRQKCVDELMKAMSIPDPVLEAVNEYNFTALNTGLAPGCDYTLMTYASNGYASVIVECNEMTDGEYNDVYTIYSEEDFLENQQGKDALLKEWNYYATDMRDPERATVRSYMSKVNITTSDQVSADPEISYIKVSGLFKDYMIESGAEGFENDDIDFMFYKGFVKTVSNSLEKPFEVNGYEAYCKNLNVINSGENIDIFDDGYLLGGFVNDHMFAFVPVTINSVVYDGFSLLGFLDKNYQRPLGVLMYVTNMLFVDPEFDDSGLDTPKKDVEKLSAERYAMSQKIKEAVNISRNSVETSEGNFKSVVDRILADNSARNYCELSKLIR